MKELGMKSIVKDLHSIPRLGGEKVLVNFSKAKILGLEGAEMKIGALTQRNGKPLESVKRKQEREKEEKHHCISMNCCSLVCVPH